MHTQLLMNASAAFLGLLGVATSFLPQEILSHFGSPPTDISVLALQIAGAMYLGFAILNWMARGVVIGGIYARPVAFGNFLHFAVVTITLLKTLAVGVSPIMLALAVLYAAFAIWFGLVLFRPAETRL